MSCSCVFREDDWGSILQITMQQDGVVVNISNATTKQILLEKPDGSLLTKTAQFTSDGTDGQIYYTVEAGVFDLVGTYKIQGYIVESSGAWHSEVDTFKVQRILS